MAYFIGFTISGVIAPLLMDKYGRKWTFLLGRLGTLACFMVILFLKETPETVYPNTTIIKLMIGGVGVLACTQVITGYNLFCEYSTVSS